MEWVALVTWVLTAGGGFVMLAIWLSRGGMQQRAGARAIRPPLILSHFLLAATGLVIWIIYIASDKSALAWIAFVILAVVALLGFTMFAIWARQRQERPVATASPGNPATTGGGAEPAGQHFPVAIVTLHGLLAVATVVLVFLVAVGVGD